MKNLFLLLAVLISLSLHGGDFGQDCKLAGSNDTSKLQPLLHYVTIRGYVEIAKVLLDRGANIDAVDTAKQWTPLFYATFVGCDIMIELLKDKGANLTIKDKFKRTANEYKKDK
ncbi:MAG: hypothetical protein DRG30_01275 [Epsilonproteobacteria bacterium]|nr:MAG: hypothetical protein DRG30_01275 [Campylobacterota bacterium]